MLIAGRRGGGITVESTVYVSVAGSKKKIDVIAGLLAKISALVVGAPNQPTKLRPSSKDSSSTSPIGSWRARAGTPGMERLKEGHVVASMPSETPAPRRG